MPVRVLLSYRLANGQPVPPPDNYPTELLFSQSNVSEEMVLATVETELFVRGTKSLDVVIHWRPVAENVH